MFQAQNRETINCTGKVAVFFEIIMTTSVTRPCFITERQTCKTKTKTDDFLVSDRSCPKTDGLRPHHWCPLLVVGPSTVYTSSTVIISTSVLESSAGQSTCTCYYQTIKYFPQLSVLRFEISTTILLSRAETSLALKVHLNSKTADCFCLYFAVAC